MNTEQRLALDSRTKKKPAIHNNLKLVQPEITPLIPFQQRLSKIYGIQFNRSRFLFMNLFLFSFFSINCLSFSVVSSNDEEKWLFATFSSWISSLRSTLLILFFFLLENRGFNQKNTAFNEMQLVSYMVFVFC